MLRVACAETTTSVAVSAMASAGLSMMPGVRTKAVRTTERAPSHTNQPAKA